jgi:cation transport protein ChaC
VGPSGPNVEYVLRLAEALRSIGAPPEEDEHVFELAALLVTP